MRFKFSTKFALCAIATVLWGIVIFLFSAQNGDDSSALSGSIINAFSSLFNCSLSTETADLLALLMRKVAHMIEFGIFGVLVLSSLYRGFGSFRGMFVTSFAISSFYAATDELHQLFVPGRSCQVTDWLIDSTGIIIYMAIAWAILRIIRVKNTLREHNLDVK